MSFEQQALRETKGAASMDATTFKIKTPCLTGGRSHTPLARTDFASVGLNYYSSGRKNTLHTHPGEDHAFVVLDGEATFCDKAGNTKVLRRVKALCSRKTGITGFRAPAINRWLTTAYKSNRPQVKRIDAQGRTREEDEVGYAYVDGEPIREQFWELS
jgi:hypothetical protein